MMSFIQNAITTKPEARYPAASQSLMAILDVHDCLPRVASTAACRRSVQGERHSRLPLNRFSKRIVLLMNEAVRCLHQFERIYGSGRGGDGLRLVSVGGGPSHPADDDCEREQNGGSQRHDRSHRSLLGRFESSPVSLLTPAQCE